MPTDLNIMVGGEAGQGIQSMGLILAKTMSRGGFHVFADQDYESRVRGGHNFYRVRISDKEVLALSEELDILIALNKETIEIHQKELKNDGITIFDSGQIKVEAQADNYMSVPLARLAEETTNNRLMSNTVAVGVVIGLIGYDFNPLAIALREQFTKSGEKVAEGNVAAARAGFDFATKYANENLKQKLKPIASGTRQMLLNGNEALSLGAIAGGCKFIASYPMTPASSILEYIAEVSKRFNLVAMHVEDEISAINMAIGAAYAGVRSMVATSGGGFSLMVEGLALAGITETPVVIVLAQRPGPATGLPTRTEQGELQFAIHAGHGEFPRAVLAPASVSDAFYAAIKAFNLAEKYQIPVIILTDQHLAASYNTVERFDLRQVKIDRGELLSGEKTTGINEYKRHLITESGISPRAVPFLSKALVVTDSDEHNEAGHMIEDSQTRNQQNLKRLRKLQGLKAEIANPRIHISPDAELTLVGWGSTYGAIKEAAYLLKKESVTVNILHLSEIWPFPAKSVHSVLNDSNKTIVIENNATGQMAHLIERETGQTIDSSILKFDGRPFSPQYIVNALKKEIS